MGLLAKIQATPHDRNRYGVQGERKITPRVELLHRYVNPKVRYCRTANGASTFGSELRTVKIRRKHNNYESECSLEEKQVWGSEKFRLSSTKARSSFLLWSS